MKASDVEKAMKERTAASVVPAVKKQDVVDYRATTISETQGARESDPLRRAKNTRPLGNRVSKRSIANDTGRSRKVLHDILDEFLDDEESEESAGDSASAEPEEESEFDFAKLQRELDAIAADESLEKLTTEVFSKSVARDAVPKHSTPFSKLCHCCGHIDGVQAWNRAHRVI